MSFGNSWMVKNTSINQFSIFQNRFKWRTDTSFCVINNTTPRVKNQTLYIFSIGCAVSTSQTSSLTPSTCHLPPHPTPPTNPPSHPTPSTSQTFHTPLPISQAFHSPPPITSKPSHSQSSQMNWTKLLGIPAPITSTAVETRMKKSTDGQHFVLTKG